MYEGHNIYEVDRLVRWSEEDERSFRYGHGDHELKGWQRRRVGMRGRLGEILLAGVSDKIVFLLEDGDENRSAPYLLQELVRIVPADPAEETNTVPANEQAASLQDDPPAAE